MSKIRIELLPPPSGLEISEEMLSSIRALYEKPKRHYHSFEHVLEVIGHFHHVDETGPGWKCPREVYCAILYHDIIYDYGAKDNEERSAALAMTELPRWLPNTTLDLNWIGRLIRLTAQHSQLKREEVSPEEALFLDCDMAIMAASWERFKRYEKEIAAEYANIYPKALYQIGRRRFLKIVQAKPRIFLSDFFHGQFEAAARYNIGKALSESP